MKRKTIHWAVAVIVMLASACSKEKIIKSPVAKAETFQKSVTQQHSTTDPASNPANPLDSVGRVHNLVMDKTSAYINQTKDTSIAGIRGVVSAFFLWRYNTDINTELIKSHEAFNNLFPNGRTDKIPGDIFDPTVEHYLNGIITAVKNVKGAGDYQATKRSIIAIEYSAMANKVLSQNSRQNVQMVASVARYSLWYWLDKMTNAGQMDTMGFFGNIWKAINVATADVAGAIGGISRLESPRAVIEDASLESSICSALM